MSVFREVCGAGKLLLCCCHSSRRGVQLPVLQCAGGHAAGQKTAQSALSPAARVAVNASCLKLSAFILAEVDKMHSDSFSLIPGLVGACLYGSKLP